MKQLTSLSLALLLSLTIAVTGCDKKDSAKADTPGSSGDKPMTIGFIYVGTKDDYGYNQAHAEGAAAVKKMAGVKVLEEEKVAETMDVQKSMESMISLDGASVIFPTSFGYYDPHMTAMAKKYPNLTFLHCGGRYKAGDPENCGSYFGYIDEAVYMSGIAAGGASKSGKLGFIAAKPIPQVLRNINAFLLGARTQNPKATVTAIFTGDWFMPTKEAEAVNNLADQGVDVVTCHVDSLKVVLETAKARKIMSCGYHTNGSALDPEGYLTGAEWNWSTVYTNYVTMLKKGEKPPHVTRGGLKDGFVKTSPIGPKVPAAAKAKIEEAKASAMAGNLVIFKGPMKDNTGKEIIPAGKQHVQTDPDLEGMSYLVEGVVGSTK